MIGRTATLANAKRTALEFAEIGRMHHYGEDSVDPLLTDSRDSSLRLNLQDRYAISFLKIRLTDHATQKLRVLRRHGVRVTRNLVEEALTRPDRIDEGLGGRQIAERGLDEDHVLRVVFMREGENVLVVTMYPARRGRY